MADFEPRRQFYIWKDNLEFYESLPNKSKFINLLIRKYREELVDESSEELEED